MINTIIFDLAEVYLNGFYKFEHRLEKALNLSPEEIGKKIEGPEFNLLMEGRITENEFVRRIINRNNWKLDGEYFKKEIRENFGEIKGTREIIENLGKAGYKLGLLSDHCKEWIEYCNGKYDYHKLFHSIQYSYEVQCCKADKKAFILILEKLKKKPKECLFIDDNGRNIRVAKSLGINTITFRDSNQLKNELNKMSINI